LDCGALAPLLRAATRCRNPKKESNSCELKRLRFITKEKNLSSNKKSPFEKEGYKLTKVNKGLVI